MPLPPLRCVDGATISSQASQAYVQAVPLANVDAAQSLLPPGESENPEAASFDVNVDGWVRGKLHSAPLTRPAVERFVATRRVLSTTPQCEQSDH